MITISASRRFTADIYVPQRKDSPHLVDLLAICLPNGPTSLGAIIMSLSGSTLISNCNI